MFYDADNFHMSTSDAIATDGLKRNLRKVVLATETEEKEKEKAFRKTTLESPLQTEIPPF
jgi:hypothetical protein